jgi:hypothetical protein
MAQNHRGASVLGENEFGFKGESVGGGESK